MWGMVGRWGWGCASGATLLVTSKPVGGVKELVYYSMNYNIKDTNVSYVYCCFECYSVTYSNYYRLYLVCVLFDAVLRLSG